MNKSKYLFIVAVAVFSLMLWGSHSFAQAPAEGGTLQAGYTAKTWDTFETSWLIGHSVVSPDYDGYLGQITDVLVDRSNGRVPLVVVSDTPGLGTEFIAIPFTALVRTGEDMFELNFVDKDIPLQNPIRGYYSIQGDRYAEYLARNRGTIGLTTIPAAIDPLWADSVYEFYGVKPYWTEGKTPHPDIVSYRETKMLGGEVQSQGGRMGGRIDDLVIGYPDGRVAFVVLDRVPGRETMVAVPFTELSMNGNAYVLNLQEEHLARAPAFLVSDLNNERKAEEIYLYFGVTPYWTETAAPR